MVHLFSVLVHLASTSQRMDIQVHPNVTALFCDIYGERWQINMFLD
jgi:hypothetical protein